jgi:hypothetical protein
MAQVVSLWPVTMEAWLESLHVEFVVDDVSLGQVFL